MGIAVNDQLIREIKIKVSLVKLAGEYTELVADGNNYKGNCPFPGHAEKTPSFTIFPSNDKNEWETYYCFGCHAGNKEETGIGNDSISFVMAMNNMSFIESCQYLCDKFGIPYQDYEVNPEVLRLKKQRTDENIKYFNNLMGNPLALSYLSDRGISSDSIRKFRLGLTTSTEYYGWRKNRLVFGITDMHYDLNKISTVAFGYRSLQGQIESVDGMEYFPNDMPTVKYRNDSESIIFDKGKMLYGLNFATQAIRKKKFAILVEGYVDVILMHQAGLDNTVASLGTSLTDEQMDLLRKYTDQLLFFQDGDAAGLKSMQRLLPRLLEKGFSVLVVEATNNMDPADLVNSFNQDYADIQRYIKTNSTPALQWCINKALKTYDSIIHKAKVDALASILPVIDKVAHRESQIAYLSNISERIGVDASIMLLTKRTEEAKKKDEKVVFPQPLTRATTPKGSAQRTWPQTIRQVQ